MSEEQATYEAGQSRQDVGTSINDIRRDGLVLEQAEYDMRIPRDMAPQHWQSWLLNIEETAAKQIGRIVKGGSNMSDDDVSLYRSWGLLLTDARHLCELYGERRLLADVEAQR